MLIINWIIYKLERKIEAYAFAALIFSKNLLAGNQSVFKNFNIIQLNIDTTDIQ